MLVVAMVVVTSDWARVVHVNKMQRQDSHYPILGTMATVIFQCVCPCIHAPHHHHHAYMPHTIIITIHTCPTSSPYIHAPHHHHHTYMPHIIITIHTCTIAGCFLCIRSDAVLVKSLSQKLDASFLFLVLLLTCFVSCLILMYSVLVCRLIFVLLCRARQISRKYIRALYIHNISVH